ncbi:hypothetical protein [Streptomyces sp. NPDC045251]|uniref:helix-turn-helix transcriptional regulator n=1 Tax=unclassified Streptomyces TaxID=2593676 RepID=UPI0033F29390
MITYDGRKLISTREAAEILGITHATLRNQKTEGRFNLEGVRIGSALFYEESQVQALAEERGK